jgi:hypothetical protein
MNKTRGQNNFSPEKGIEVAGHKIPLPSTIFKRVKFI